MLTSKTCRAARALLGWSQTDLAKGAGLGLSTIYDFEGDRRAMPSDTEGKIKAALEGAGVVFLSDGPGVQLKARRRT